MTGPGGIKFHEGPQLHRAVITYWTVACRSPGASSLTLTHKFKEIGEVMKTSSHPKCTMYWCLAKPAPIWYRVRASVYVSIFQTSFTGMWIFFEEICSSRKQLNPIKAPCGQTYLPAIAVQGVGSNRILVTVPVPEQFSKAWSTNVATHFRLRQTGG